MANPKILHSGIGSKQSIYAVDTTQNHDIGEVGVLPGGRVFRYGRYTESGALTRGKFAVAQTLSTQNEDLATGTTSMVVGNDKVTDITLGSVAVTTTQKFQYLAVVDGGGEGLMFRIRSHPTALATASDFQVTLFDTIPVASDANTQVSLIQDVYANFKIAVTDQADVPAGNCNVTVPAGDTNKQYSWVQTAGPATAWVAGTPGEGTALMVDTSTAGNLAAVDQTITVTVTSTSMSPALTDSVNVTPIVAYQMGVDGANNEVQAVNLCVRGV